MLDPEAYVFTRVAAALREQFDSVSVYPEEVDVPASFPCSTLVMSSDSSYRPSMTGDNRENHVNVMFTGNTYSNLLSGAKTQCKDMMDVMDSVMRGMGFVRTMNEPMPNYERTISRRTARWSGIVGADGYVYKS